MKKQLECSGGCKDQYLDMVVVSCKKCIRHISVPLTQKQKDAIIEILAPTKTEEKIEPSTEL